MGDEGFETSPDVQRENAIRELSAADSGADGGNSGLKRLAELWPMIAIKDRAAILALAEKLAALNSGLETSPPIHEN